MDAPGWPLVDRAPPLQADEVQVWQVALDSEEHARRLEPLLAADERDRAARFHFPRDRRRYVIGRGWLRVLLGEYLAIPPTAICLEASPLGKPCLAGEPGSDLRFNVAHSADVALIAVTRGREIGVDVEGERPDVRWPDLAERFFAPVETAAIQALPEPERRAAFFRCWTRKEAYLKALGLGLHVNLDGFAVTVADESAALLHTSHDPAQSGRWSLRGLNLSPGFAAAVAVEGVGWQLFCGRRAEIP